MPPAASGVDPAPDNAPNRRFDAAPQIPADRVLIAMGWRFRKSFKVLPGVRIHVTNRGVSTTIGGGPLSLHLSDRGAFANVRIPGSGVSYRERIDVPDVPPRRPELPLEQERVAIESASTHALAKSGLSEFQRLLTEAHSEQQALDAEIAVAAPESAQKTARFHRWNDGFLFKHLFHGTFAQVRADAHEAAERLDELQEQRKLASLATTIEVAEEQQQPFGRLCDAFARLTNSHRIWDTLAIQRADQYRERTLAVHSVHRQPVRFVLGGSPLLVCDWRVPHLSNANGGDLFLYPGFVLYQVSRQSFAVIDMRDVRLDVRGTRYIEEEAVPADAYVVGETWKKANKDGSPDRRFANNYRIPIAKYAEMSMKTASGLNEQYMISNVAAAEHFARSWDAYVTLFGRQY
jgi:hypothetical protein